MEFYAALVVCLVLISGINFSQACNGYKLTVKKIENCAGPNQIFKIDENSTTELTTDCKLILNGCGHAKAFKTASLTYLIKKNGNRVFAGVSDTCKDVEKAKEKYKDMEETLQKFGLPSKCPVDEMNKCVENAEVDFSKLKGMMAIASGNLEIHVEAKHDTGESCINVALEIKK